MSLATKRTVVRCPNQHEFETEVFDSEPLAIERFVCELCGAKFSIARQQPPLAEERPENGKPDCSEGPAEKR